MITERAKRLVITFWHHWNTTLTIMLLTTSTMPYRRITLVILAIDRLSHPIHLVILLFLDCQCFLNKFCKHQILNWLQTVEKAFVFYLFPTKNSHAQLS
ncbi:hypothetical protein GZ78_20220 [Endozoicomonas numazuensis]|uniref:Uncharacterized protein n=1 Tax=Endozoicomonas numazuensis TaxID=1137799 RepID=A0A081NET2_9GAMM|nr:hypothetical protein GZ78_20220 [Endozoicomonas numazuensis]